MRRINCVTINKPVKSVRASGRQGVKRFIGIDFPRLRKERDKRREPRQNWNWNWKWNFLAKQAIWQVSHSTLLLLAAYVLYWPGLLTVLAVLLSRTVWHLLDKFLGRLEMADDVRAYHLAICNGKQTKILITCLAKNIRTPKDCTPNPRLRSSSPSSASKELSLS